MNNVTPLSPEELKKFEANCYAVLQQRVFAPFRQTFTPAMLRSTRIAQHRLMVETKTSYDEKLNVVVYSGHLKPHANDILVHSPAEGEQALKAWMATAQAQRRQSMTELVYASTQTNETIVAHEVQEQRRFLLHLICQDCDGIGYIPCPRCDATGRVTCPRCTGEKTITCTSCDGSGVRTCRECGGTTRVRCTSCSGGQTSCTSCGGSGKVYHSYDNQYHACTGCYGGRVNCSYCSGTGYNSCYSCSGGYVTCSTCRGSGVITCPECSGKGDLTCQDCKGKREIRCGPCEGTGKLTSVRQCLYDIRMTSNVAFDDTFPKNIAEYVRDTVQSNSFCQLCVDIDAPYDTVCDGDEPYKILRYFGAYFPIAECTVDFLNQPLECTLFGRTTRVHDIDSLHKTMMQLLLRPISEFLDFGKWLLPFGWLRVTARLRSLLRVPIIREQMSAGGRQDWTPMFHTLVARMRRVLRLAAVLPAIVGIVLPVAASRELAHIWLAHLANTLARGWESLCHGGGVLVEKMVQGLFWLDRSMAATVVETVQNAYTDAAQVVHNNAQTWEAIATGWNLVAGQLAHPFCTWLMVWGVLLPSALLVVTRLLFYGWKRYIGGKLFLAWCTARLPAEKSALVCVWGLSTALLFVSQCLRWMFDLP